MNFSIKEEYKPVEELTDEELEDCPSSQGFWYGICDGDGEMFIDMLKDRATQEACRQAIQILSQLENAVENYVDWY